MPPIPGRLPDALFLGLLPQHLSGTNAPVQSHQGPHTSSTMAQGYYTLEEAAQILSISTDELKQIARRGEIRSFQDRGTWRFRVQDVQEMARRRGAGSDPELRLGEQSDSGPKSSGPKSGPKSTGPKTPKVGSTKSSLAGAPKSGSTKSSLASGPKSGPKTPPSAREAEVFDFTLEVEDEAVDLGSEFGDGGPKSGQRANPPSSHKGPKSPVPHSDSDVRLVTNDAGIDFQIEMDSDVKLVDSPGSGAAKPAAGPGKGPDSSKRKMPETAPSPPDSGVRLVPMDSDSDVRITDGSDDSVLLGATPERTNADSDIRLEMDKGSDSGEGMLATEEIDLDEEIRRKEKQQPPRVSKFKPAQPPQLPTSSPFELTDSALMLPDDSDLEMPIPPPQGSDETALMPLGESSSPLEPSSSDKFRLEIPDDASEAGTAGEAPNLKGPSSGINLGNPVDSGISLEQESEGSDEIDFTINIDDESGGPSTPRVTRGEAATAATSPDDSSSEFEVALPGGAEDSSSEFELALDSNEAVPALGEGSGTVEESSSDFELAISDEAPLVPEDNSDFELTVDSNEELPALESESSSSEESEFELTLESDEVPVETKAADESSSEFELTLDSGEGEGVDLTSDSEFELTLEEEGPPASAEKDSSSEFELSLDADAGLAPMEGELAPLEEEAAEQPVVEEAGLEEISEVEEEESGSQVVALEEEPAADLESGDFEMQVPGEESTSDEESGSEVVALEEEEVGDEFGIAAGEKGAAGFEDLGAGLEEEEGAGETVPAPAGEPLVIEKEVVAAPWGPLPVVFMLPCVIVLLLVGMMGFEMVQSMTGYKQPGLVTRTLSSLVGMEIKN